MFHNHSGLADYLFNEDHLSIVFQNLLLRLAVSVVLALLYMWTVLTPAVVRMLMVVVVYICTLPRLSLLWLVDC